MKEGRREETKKCRVMEDTQAGENRGTERGEERKLHNLNRERNWRYSKKRKSEREKMREMVTG